MTPGDAPFAAIKADAVGLAGHQRRLTVAPLFGHRRQGHLQTGVEDRRVQAIVTQPVGDGFRGLDPPERLPGAAQASAIP